MSIDFHIHGVVGLFWFRFYHSCLDSQDKGFGVEVETGFTHLTLRFVDLGLSFNDLLFMLFFCLCQLYRLNVAWKNTHVRTTVREVRTSSSRPSSSMSSCLVTLLINEFRNLSTCLQSIFINWPHNRKLASNSLFDSVRIVLVHKHPNCIAHPTLPE